MTSENAPLGIRHRITGALARPAVRVGLVALGIGQAAVPLAGAIVGALFADRYLAAHVTGGERLAYIAVAAVVVLAAVDRTVSDATHRLYQRVYASVYGPRTWSCEDCGAAITAERWSPGDALVFEQHLADPAAHGCNPAPQQ